MHPVQGIAVRFTCIAAEQHAQPKHKVSQGFLQVLNAKANQSELDHEDMLCAMVGAEA